MRRQWVEQGARIIGGCCGIGPEHIRALNENLITRERLSNPPPED